jgi:small subunit ribosomal protein S15
MAEEKTETKAEDKEAKKPEWVKLKPAEVEKIVVDLYKKGESPAKIGSILRDKHGVPKAKALGKRILEIVKDSKLTINMQKDIIKKQMDALNEHVKKNKHDQPAKKKLVKYLWAMKSAEESNLPA